MTARSSTCYMCAARETSKEHAPPQCLFPEASGIGQDLRRNLITVPSCDEHNSKKSADDEFLRAVILLTAADSNKIAKHQFLGKFLRGAERNSKAHSAFFKDKGLRYDQSSGMFALAGRFYEFFEIYCASSMNLADAVAE